MHNQQLRQEMIKLRLHGMLSVITEETHEQWVEHYGFLKKLVEAEAAYRRSRSLAYRTKLSRMYQVKTLSDFVTDGMPPSCETLNALTDCSFVKQKENILLIGGSGSGKTHIATALGYQALQRGYRVKFYLFSELARQLMAAQQHNNEAGFMSKLMRFNVLVIDELGYFPIEERAANLLLEFISGCYERVSLIIATHLTFDEWQDVFGSAKSASGMIDRTTHHSHIIETGSDSWRFKEASQ